VAKTIPKSKKKMTTHHEPQHLLETISDGFVAIDRNWKYVYINNQAGALSNQRREDLLGRSLLEVHPNFTKTIFYRKYKEALEKGKTLRFEFYYDFLDAWFLVNVYPTKDGLSVFFNNITQQKKSADQLMAEKAKSDATLASIGEGVVTTDNLGRIEVVNSQAEIMLGFKAEEIIGKDFDEVWSVEDDQGRRIPRPRRIVTLVLSQHKKVTRTKNYFVTERRRFPAAATASPIIVGKQIRGAVVVFRDTHKEREVDRAKSEFVSMASHQLRTPLTAIKLFTEMLQQGGTGRLNKSAASLVDNVHETNEKMIHLVNNLLDVSRMESGRMKFKWEAVDLNEQIEKVIADAAPIAVKREIRLQFKTEFKKAPLLTDASLFRQVILNLVTNAIFYTKETGAVIIVTLTKEGSKQYLISVEDRGIGIPAEAQIHIFERFFRAENAVQAKADGSGLGLYMSKMIVEKLEGKIWVRSTPGQGTTFYVSLPLHKTS
jgi:PAS domain S-box-containing protein